MKKRQKLLTDEQWELIAPSFPEPRRRRDKRGRPWAANRACFEGILWILQTGAAWRALLGLLDEQGLLRWDETFLDGSFAPAKKGALPSVKPSAARARSGWYWSTVKVFRWEFGWKVPLRQKLRLRKPRSPKSASRAPKADHGRSRSA